MRSSIATDTAKGLLVCLALVLPALFVVNVLNRHAEEHGHCVPFPMLDMKRPERDQGDGGGVGQGVDHARIVSAQAPEKHVRGGCP